jgi:DNA primase
MSSIDDVKARIDIVDLVSEAGVKLRHSGRNYTGFCPFHGNTRTPAFVVWPESGTWRCFGECNEGGDIFKFVMKREGVDFKEALRRLAEKAGVQLEEYTPKQVEQREENDRLRSLLEDAVTFYRHHLINTPAGKSAFDYLLQKRKLTPQTIETFGLGYAPEAWDTALKYFLQKGFSELDLYDAGLATQRDSGGYYDRFRHRIMIPIRDAEGRMTGFGARIHPDDPNKDQAKFINTAETPIFSKGRLLYGLDRARKPIRAADQAVIVEGYLDVIALHQAGFENVVSPMGTALTEDQLRLLKRFTRKVVLALDPDAAGQKAVLRGLDAARASMDREEELRFDARGLLRHEARLQADLRVARMPDDLDPDEIVQRNPDQWKQLIAGAKPIVEHVMETLLAGQSADDPKVKADITRQMLPLIDDLATPVERDSYRQMLARRLRVDERALISTQAAGAKPARRAARTKAEPAAQTGVAATAASVLNPTRKIEANVLAILLKHPDLLPRLDRDLQEKDLSAVTVQDFDYTDHQTILRLVRQSLEQDAIEPVHFVEENVPEPMVEIFKELAAQKIGSTVTDKLLDELYAGIRRLRLETEGESITQLYFLQKENEQQDPVLAKTYGDLSVQHSLKLRHLHLAPTRRKGIRKT